MSRHRDLLRYPAAGTIHDRIRALVPASFWPMQEASGNLSDAFGGITGTANGTLAYNQSGPGGLRSILFDGSSGYFDCTDIYDFPNNDPFTVVVIVIADAPVAAARIVSKIVSATSGWDMLLPNTGGHVRYSRGTSSGTANQDLAASMRRAAWTTLALGYDGATTYGYSNGRLMGSAASAGTNTGHASTLKIGRQANSATAYWSGRIAGVAIFTRSLSAIEHSYIGSPG